MKRKRRTSPGQSPNPGPTVVSPVVTHRWRRLAIAAVVLSLAGALILTFVNPIPRFTLRRAEAALAREEFANAQRLAEQVLAHDPTSSPALLVASAAAAGQQRLDQAIAYLERVTDEGNENTVTALRMLGDYAARFGYVTKAEAYLRRAFRYDETNRDVAESLISLLVRAGRMWEAQELILPLMIQGQVNSNHLIVVSSPEIWLADPSSYTAVSLAAVPDDPLPLLAEAGQAWRSNDLAQAEDLLRKIINIHPESLESQAQLGRILAESGDPTRFLQWQTELPESATEHPLIWFAWGRWAQRQNQTTAAARCYGETLMRQPNHTAANYQLSQVLVAMGQAEQAQPFAERSEQLARLVLMIDSIKEQRSPDKIQPVVELLESLGRPREAAGWCEVVLRDAPATPWALATHSRMKKLLSPDVGFTLNSHNPARQLDLSKYPLPQWQLDSPIEPAPEAAPTNLAGVIRFDDLAAAAGLDFTYENGATDDGFESLLEMNGGGIGILDYDNDGWPDIYFTQGGLLPPRVDGSSPTNRLFRNLGNGTFQDVTAQSGLGDSGYAQGVTVGDFDNDGLPDLYIANIGPNRLYHNHGDGTFRDVTDQAGAAGTDWTSSCLIADLNGDGLPDLYAVNYIGGDDLFDAVCRKHAGRRCAPVDFPAAQDRIYLNLGDGRFEDITDQSGIVAAGGRGLGIIAADLDGSHRLSLYVANDMSANFLFANQTPSRGDRPLFSERGILSGLGLSSQGIAQAGMGIAAGDANADEQLDLFVTNFYREPNNLYIQQADGLFEDKAKPANLWDAGFAMLGWGAQFLDADLDGYSDLIVSNGHVHDPVVPQIPYRMPPQLFRNLGIGEFSLQQRDTLGKYFEGEYLGRAVARVDWNRDGLDDVCVMHLDTPVALLTNHTQQRGHFLSLRLVGTQGDRDAIGASVRVTGAGRKAVYQLVAGDGFQASNQRQLTIGLGDTAIVEHLEITWPSGTKQSFSDVSADHEFLAIENHDQLILQR